MYHSNKPQRNEEHEGELDIFVLFVSSWFIFCLFFVVQSFVAGGYPLKTMAVKVYIVAPSRQQPSGRPAFQHTASANS